MRYTEFLEQSIDGCQKATNGIHEWETRILNADGCIVDSQVLCRWCERLREEVFAEKYPPSQKEPPPMDEEAYHRKRTELTARHNERRAQKEADLRDLDLDFIAALDDLETEWLRALEARSNDES